MNENNFQSSCPVCGGDAEREKYLRADGDSVRSVDCVRCGNYTIDDSCTRRFKVDGSSYKASAVLREHSERGEPLHIDASNIGSFDERALNSFIEKAQHFLRVVALKTGYPGRSVRLDDGVSYPLAYARDDEELFVIATYLQDSGRVTCESDSEGLDCQLTGDGWVAVETEHASNELSDKVFVAMWFDPSMDEVYSQGIMPALDVDTGYRAIRIDNVEHTGKIDDRIIAEIKESRFLVADFTGQRGGVYFEVGFAMGLGLPVIWTCREDEIGKVHFDTRQYNHIVWKTPGDLREKLAVRIRATVGRRGGLSRP